MGPHETGEQGWPGEPKLPRGARSPEGSGTPEAHGLPEVLGDAALPEDLVIPDDISGLFAASPSRVVFLVPLRSAKLAAALARLLEVDALALDSANGALLVAADASEAGLARSAAALSSLNDRLEIVAVRRGPSEDPGAQDVQVSHWAGGAKVGDMAPGILLAGASAELERLIVFMEPLDGFAGIESMSLTKARALKELGSRRARKQVGE